MSKVEEYHSRLEGLKGSLKSFGNAATVTDRAESFVSAFLWMSVRKEGSSGTGPEGLKGE